MGYALTVLVLVSSDVRSYRVYVTVDDDHRQPTYPSLPEPVDATYNELSDTQ